MKYKNEFEAVEDSIIMWQWLYDNFPVKKKQHPDYNKKYADLSCSCPLCEYDNQVSKDNDNIGDCSHCCLYDCVDNGYSEWEYYHKKNKNKLIGLLGAYCILKRLKERKKELTDEVS